MLNKQVYIHSVDTRSFYNSEEEISNSIQNNLVNMIKIIEQFVLLQFLENDNGKFVFENIDDLHKQKELDKDFKVKINRLHKKHKKTIKTNDFIGLLSKNVYYDEYVECQKEFKIEKAEFKKLLENNNNNIRTLNPEKVSKYNIVSIFDSYLTRILNLEYNKLSTDLFIVKIYYYPILKQLIENGCKYMGEDYIFFTASAGQIRENKIVMIKEKLWKQYANTLMCGLTIEKINNMTFAEYKGCNINKYLSYLALCNGATDKWDNFDIDKAIVIDDFETMVDGEVDFIDKTLQTKTKKVKNKNGEKEKIEIEYWELAEKPNRKTMKIPITHSDGCGWILPNESRKNFMVRLPWMKGLLTPVDYLAWCRDYNKGNYKVIDIYGKEWDLLKDGIKYVFSRSQFKMWKYYSNQMDNKGNKVKYGWDIYKENFKKHNCHASKCNIEPNSGNFKNKSVPYQMWQTLTDLKHEEIDYFTKNIIEYIKNAYTQRDSMLDILGAAPKNEKKTYLQQALEIYPELLKDPYIKNELSEIINSKKNEAKYGGFDLGDNAKYTFILPDVFAWLEYCLGGNKNPKGLLEDGEVSCRLYKDEEEICVNRNPHLYREWGVRNNIAKYINENWFITNGVYTSCHDLISKLLMFDNDGDTTLVIKGKLVDIAKRNMITKRHILVKRNIKASRNMIAKRDIKAKRNIKGIVPLYYEMGTANPQEINAENTYNSLVAAFKYGNIGEYSNKLTKLWNSKNPNFDVIKTIVSLNNFSIDAAKTLEMPKAKGDMAKKILEISNIKMPYFFQFVKKDYKNNVEETNDSTVNRICKKIEDIPQKKFVYNQIGTFRYDNLLGNKKIEINNIVVNEYERLNKEMQEYFYKNHAMTKEEISRSVWDIMRMEFDLFCKENNIKYEDAVDMIIRYMYKPANRSRMKGLLFNVFGDVIVQNLKNNIGSNSIICSKCSRRAKKTSNRQTMCPSCADKAKKERSKTGMQKLRDKNAS